MVVDERADEAQRNALVTILSGGETEAGATVFNVFAATYDTVFDPLFSAIDIDIDVDARVGHVKVDGIGESSGRPILNPVTGEPHRARISLPQGFEYTLAEVGMAVMWWVMMIAMMVPSAAPMVLLYARVQRYNLRHSETTGAAVPTAAFLVGYLLAWLLFSLLATALQWGLEQAALVHGMLMWSTSATLSGILLVAAGLYQFSPLKGTCLSHCRSPAAFLSRHWRRGRSGALRMGLEHGCFCVGCCWFLMLLLFVGGIMNLVWIAALTLLVLLEKLLPRGAWVARASGCLMLAAVGYLLLW
jgi:predicted metal-binding membrane protein